MSVWQLSVLSALGLLSLVGLASTLGVRLRSCDERPVWRRELVVASASAVTWMAVQLTFFSIVPWWGRLVLGCLLSLYVWLMTMSQMWGTVSAAYLLRRTAEADSAGQEVRP